LALDNATLLVNESVNQTVQTTMPGPIDYALNTAVPRIADLLLAPVEHPDMLWTLGPMIIALILMQLYFGRNKDEALGWNTAFGNSVALIFISASLLRGVYISSGDISIKGFLMASIYFNDLRIIIILLLFMYGILLATISFFHWFPEKLAFFIMNGISINITAYVVIVLVISENIPLDKHTLLAGVVIFILVYAASIILKSFIPQSTRSKMHRLESSKYIIEANIRLFKEEAKTAKSDYRKERLNTRVQDLQDKADDISKRIEDLKRKL
jgi:hypothetical protein